MSLCFVIESKIYRRKAGTLLASCTAILITNFPACLTSSPPRAKKKLALRRTYLKYFRVIIRVIVNFPMPAKPFSQKIHRSSYLSAQPYISRRSSMRVLEKHEGECCFIYELNGALTAYGKRLNAKFLVNARLNCRVKY
jgi:hypothetical protein